MTNGLMQHLWEIHSIMTITGRTDIKKLLDYIFQVHQELLCQQWSEKYTWSGKRQALYSNGVIFGMYNEKDKELLKLLEEDVENKALYNELLIEINRRLQEYRAVKDRSLMDKCFYIHAENEKKSLEYRGLNEWIEKNCSWLPENLTCLSQKRAFLYIYLVFKNLCADKSSLYNNDVPNIISLYKDIFKKNSQLRKYGLIPIDNSRELLVIDPPRIYDKTIDTTIFIKGMPKDLLNTIKSLKSQHIIQDVSFRVSDYPIIEGKTELQELSEALDRGKAFELSDLNKQVVSRFHSKDYENCLWIIIDQDEMIFEELYQDFDEYNDCIVTQMVHLKYALDATQYYISHLDHEYIFYSSDEYIERLNNPRKKGTANKRIKSFKIDNSCIPFLLQIPINSKAVERGVIMENRKEFFLPYVLEFFFVHKDLLKEYFSSICIAEDESV